MRFDGRITGIVGPNGCGKTNIVDAIRWGMGEQRPSVLRADRMENMIFGGAQSSRPLGMAEVSVHFDNSSHVLPIDYTEVVVTRRLYRSGDSEYLLNKNQVRLKDINDLFMDTGIGADAYSVIELKMVEDILSEKAEDRRKLLEEAAGVTKYKHRLKAAMRKLDATRNDHLRVNDIIHEVQRTVNSLKRQVQRARRYQVHQEKIKALELASGRVILAQLQDQLAPLKKEMALFQKQKEGRTTELSKEEAEIETARLELVEKEKALIKAREDLAAVVERIHRGESDIRVGKERISSLRERVAGYEQEIEELKKRHEDQISHLGVAESEREALTVKITSTGRIFTNKQKELEVYQQGLNLKRLDLNSKKKEIITCLEEIGKLHQEETELRARIDNHSGRLDRLDEEDAAYRKSADEAKRRRTALMEKHRDLSSEKGAAEKSRDRISAEEEKEQKSLEACQEQLYREQSDKDLLTGRIAFFKNIVEAQEGVSDGTRLIIREKPGGLRGILGDLLETKPKTRDAVEVGLGEAASYLIFNTDADVYRALDVLKGREGGRAAFISLSRVKRLGAPGRHARIPKEVKTLGWGDDAVTCDEGIGPVVAHLLGDLLIVEDMTAAREVLKRMTDDRIRVATLQGELVTPWGVIRRGESSDKDIGLVGRLQRIKELEARVKDLDKKIAESEASLAGHRRKKDDLRQKREKLDQNLNEIDQSIVGVDKELAQADYEAKRTEEGIQNNSRERQKILEEIEKGRDALENIRPRMEGLADKREALETVSGQIAADVERMEKEERKMEEDVHRQNITVVRLNGEAKNLDYDIERSRSIITEIETTIEQRQSGIEKAKEEIAGLTEDISRNEENLAKDFSERESQEKLMHEREAAYQELQEDLRLKEKEVRDVRRDRDEVSERTHQLELRIADLEHRAKSLTDRIKESYETDLKKVPVQEDVDLEAAAVEIENLKRKIKAIGPVNLAALQEYDQEKERLDFLNKQKDDLLSAEETLKETILRINQTARHRFGEVFKQVQANFRDTFCRFFKGGEADLRLPEGEDPLEAQIEIVARPAGKHFRDLSLLSGGERALTAISLLFALYLVKPSPFCILDEIDAPLDDANVERFTRVLEEFAEKTQFVIVTHNKRTMRAAQALYGVTMEEEGVSKVVSVRFEDSKKEPAGAAG